MRYLVTGCTITNDIIYADGSRAEGFLGGALYTANGIKPYCDDVLLVTTAGPDFDKYYGEYYQTNGYSTDGVERVLTKTRYNYLEYSPDGRWIEYSKFGAEFDEKNCDLFSILPEYAAKHADEGTLGIYSESGVNERFWTNIPLIREKAPNAKIMWELYTVDVDIPETRKKLLPAIKKNCDIYSLNLPESKDLFGTSSEEESVKAIIDFGMPCFFRVGKKGAYMIEDGKAWFAGSIDFGKSVDATGCGNCSTGAAMYGFCEGLHPLKTVICANLAAGVNASHTGPYPRYTKELRERLTSEVDERFAKLIKEYN